MSDQVRFYLEQSIPELEDLEQRGLFTKKEIAQLVRKRTDFEHRITGRQSRPRDFLRYAHFEINLEALRMKRIARLGNNPAAKLKKNRNRNMPAPTNISDYAGRRRINFVFDRGTKKFAGDADLWKQHIAFLKHYKMMAKLSTVHTNMLKLFPNRADIWIMVAKHEFDENSAAQTARSVFQRGLRFNPESKKLWLEYTKLELLYVSKILTRRKLLGILADRDKQREVEEVKEVDNDNVIALPELDGDDEIKAELKTLPEADIDMLGNPSTNPALRGDVALAIFDSALETIPRYSSEINTGLKNDDGSFTVALAPHFAFLLSFSRQYLELFDEFEDMDREYLCAHVIQAVLQQINKDIGSSSLKLTESAIAGIAQLVVDDITLSVRYLSPLDAAFPEAFKLTLNKYNVAMSKTWKKKGSDRQQQVRKQIASQFKEKLADFLNAGKSVDREIDENLKRALKAVIKKTEDDM